MVDENWILNSSEIKENMRVFWIRI